jgi:mono/diheme cytochrome c family protein
MKFDSRSVLKSVPAIALMAAWFAGSAGFDFSTAKNSSKPQGDSPAKAKSESPYAEIVKVPEKERAKRNPLENDAIAIATGGKLFAEHCAECHGNMAEGGQKAPQPPSERGTGCAARSARVLTNGVVRRGMPVWSKLPEPQRWQIVSFLKSLRED